MSRLPEWLKGAAKPNGASQERYDLYDIRLDEVSLVDKGDNPEAHVVFFKSASAPSLKIRKVEFNELLRARLAERVIAELMAYVDTLGDSVRSALFEGEDPEAQIRTNLDQFLAAATASVDAWAERAKDPAGKVAAPTGGDMAKMVLGAAAYAYQEKINRNGGIEKMARFTKASDVLAEATREAEKLMKAAPERYRSIASARADVWRDRPDLADALQSFPLDDVRDAGRSQEAATGVSKLAPVEKGQGAVDQATEKAREMMMQHPDRYGSIEQARAQVWKLYPELAEQYQREAYA